MSFEFDFTRDHLAEIIPGNKQVDEWYAALYEVLPMYEITTERRVAHFLSQCAHESANFKRLEENLNYSAKALRAVFGRYFGDPPKRDADEYHRQPEMIANYVYMDEFRKYKMGNIHEGDGWLFRGRGLKQLTGRENYSRFGDSIGMTAEEAAEYVQSFNGAIQSACWFWDTNNLNDIADGDNVKLMTKKINGGSIGLEDRQRRYINAMEVLGMPFEVHEEDDDDEDDILDDIGVLRRGSRGDGVKLMQEALGLDADGVFGRGTERALKLWQTDNGLTPDGVAGPLTMAKLLDD
jgi:putative chitinase|tara:strand:- start:959 stop:1840 length:882 start_codon:yes stop_codon:yes gene_type:complete